MQSAVSVNCCCNTALYISGVHANNVMHGSLHSIRQADVIRMSAVPVLCGLMIQNQCCPCHQRQQPMTARSHLS